MVAWNRDTAAATNPGRLVGAIIETDGTPRGRGGDIGRTRWANPPAVASLQPVATLAVDEATGNVYALYSDAATNDLWLATRDGSWGTDVELWDGDTVQLLSANIFLGAPPRTAGRRSSASSPTTRAARVWVTANQTGSFGGLRFLGQAKVVDPRGRVLARSRAREGLAVASIDPYTAVGDARARLCHLDARRPEGL